MNAHSQGGAFSDDKDFSGEVVLRGWLRIWSFFAAEILFFDMGT